MRSTDRRITITRDDRGLDIVCYSDADLGGDRDDRKSVSGILVLINGTPVMWRSTKQLKFANLTAVVEFNAAARATRGKTWLRNIMLELGIEQRAPIPLKVGNQTAISLTVNNKVLDIDLLTVRDLHVEEIGVSFMLSAEQFADCPAKPLNSGQFNKLLDESGLRRHKPSETSKPSGIAALETFGLVMLAMGTPCDARAYREWFESIMTTEHSQAR